MKIKVKISREEFTKLLFAMTYRKTSMIAFAAFKMVLIIYLVFVFAQHYNEGWLPNYCLFMALFLAVSTPLRLYYMGRKTYSASRFLKEEIQYDLTEEKIIARGETFNGERSWGTPHTVIELKDWFVIYDSKIVFNPIPKKCMTAVEQTELKNILMKLKTVKPSSFK